jgi:hypothetical protein
LSYTLQPLKKVVPNVNTLQPLKKVVPNVNTLQPLKKVVPNVNTLQPLKRFPKSTTFKKGCFRLWRMSGDARFQKDVFLIHFF